MSLDFNKFYVSFGQAETNSHTERDWHNLKGKEIQVVVVNSHDPSHDVNPDAKCAEHIEHNQKVLQSALDLLPLVLAEGRAHFWVCDLQAVAGELQLFLRLVDFIFF